MENDYLPQLSVEIALEETPGRALDVGPGNGTLAIWLAKNGWKVDVLDVVPLGTFITQDILREVPIGFHQCSIELDEDLPDLPPADLMLMSMVFGHLKYRPDETLRRLVTKYLKPTGTFLCCNLDHARFAPKEPYAYERWKDMPRVGEAEASPLMNTCPFTEDAYFSLLSGVFADVNVWAEPSSPHIFASCRKPLGWPLE